MPRSDRAAGVRTNYLTCHCVIAKLVDITPPPIPEEEPEETEQEEPLDEATESEEQKTGEISSN